MKTQPAWTEGDIAVNVERRLLGGCEFWYVGPLQLRRTADGRLEEYTHVLDDTRRLNAYAAGPFCRMSIPSAPHAEGVYAIFVGDELRYVGECQDLAGRFGSSGYGQIQPRNCYHDGQSTNCKLNARVLAAAKEGLTTHVWFHATNAREAVEARLLLDLAPPWNGRQERPTDAVTIVQASPLSHLPHPRRSEPTGVVRDFQAALRDILSVAEQEGQAVIQVRAGDLHRRVGGYPGPKHRMPVCCSAMRSAMKPGDRIVQQPPKGNGANLLVEYRLPRSA